MRKRRKTFNVNMQNIKFMKQCSVEAGRPFITLALDNASKAWGSYVINKMAEGEVGLDAPVYSCAFYVVMWTVEGKATVRCGGHDKLLTRQKMLCIRPGVRLQWTEWDKARVVCFVFSEAQYLQLNALLRDYLDQNVFGASGEMFFTRVNNCVRMVNMVMQMEYDRKHCKSARHRQMLMASQLGYLLERIAEMDTVEEHKRHHVVTDREQQIYRDFSYMVERHFKQHWSMAAYAKALGVCDRLLYNSVKKVTGQSPFYIVNNRLYTECLRVMADGAVDKNNQAMHLGFPDFTAMRRWLNKRTEFDVLL